MYVIAEAGINHNGSIGLAKKLIDMAVRCGADCVKFQKRTPRKCVTENEWDKIKKTPWGPMTYIEYKERMEFGKLEFDIIDEYCKEKGIEWTASVWDEESVDFLMQYDIPFIKLPSAMITNWPLMKKVKEAGKPIVISTGMSTMKEVTMATMYLGNWDASHPLGIMLCNSTYPAKDDELDLEAIKLLKEMYPKHTIGYSGHEQGIYPSIVAAAFGAEIIERHITLDSLMWGTDQKASLEEWELEELIDTVKKIDIWKGKKRIHCYESEEQVKKKLRPEIE
jgi:N-acetylneuraminate synthase